MSDIFNLKAVLSIALASFEMQACTVQLLRADSTRSNIIKYNKELLEFLLKTIEEIERKTIAEIEKETEETLGYSAEIAKSHKDIIPAHVRFTKFLAEEEDAEARVISAQCLFMKNEIKKRLQIFASM